MDEYGAVIVTLNSRGNGKTITDVIHNISKSATEPIPEAACLLNFCYMRKTNLVFLSLYRLVFLWLAAKFIPDRFLLTCRHLINICLVEFYRGYERFEPMDVLHKMFSSPRDRTKKKKKKGKHPALSWCLQNICSKRLGETRGAFLQSRQRKIPDEFGENDKRSMSWQGKST